MKRRSLFCAAMVGLALWALGSGCSTAPPGGKSDPLPPQEYPPVVTGDLHDAVHVGHPIVDPSDDTRPMRVEFPVRNLADSVVYVQYRYEFYDNAGHLLTQSDRWQSATLEPKIERRLEGAALNLEARKFRLYLRPQN